MYIGGRGWEILFNENFKPEYTPRFTKADREEFNTRIRFIKLISKSVYTEEEFHEIHSIPLFMSSKVERISELSVMEETLKEYPRNPILP